MQYPAIASIKYGTSALLDCIFDFQFLSEAEIEVYWNIQLLLSNDSMKKITMSSKRLPLNQSALLSRDDGKYKLTGNLLKGVVFLEVKNLQPRDVGLYTCKVARLIPPPYLEGSSNGTYICVAINISVLPTDTRLLCSTERNCSMRNIACIIV
uniref:Ig-like domain-containing protein n=1 Tax=Terrapene triunguis TaxID=2587831 RepID=A0A674K6U1_9SAUR